MNREDKEVRDAIEAAEARVAVLEKKLALKDDLLRAYRTGDHRLADRTLTRLAALADGGEG